LASKLEIGCAAVNRSAVATEEIEPTRPARVRSQVEAPKHEIEWPSWANLALLAVVVTSIVTIAAAINDIW
jgi:hypothetical protein